MSAMPEKPATTPIPVQLSASEFTQGIFPHLTMPTRGPRCTLGYHRVFHLILGVLSTGRPWQCWPVPNDSQGHAAIQYTTVYRVFARWSGDGSLEDAFMASGGPLSDHTPLDLRVLHGDGSGDSGDTPQQGEKVIAIIDNHG